VSAVTDAVEDESGTVLLGVADDGVATLTLNRPRRHNCWTRPTTTTGCAP
jgi:enoyl-CoA hydratase/carnithine racemase